MTGIPPYTAAAWQSDWEQGHRLACPRCGSDEDFAPRQAVRADRTFRRYRSCKRCGLCQEADGASGAYQTVAMTHHCQAVIPADTPCRGCGTRPRAGAAHACHRILRDGEIFTCPECGTTLGDEHRLAWANPGPWAGYDVGVSGKSP